MGSKTSYTKDVFIEEDEEKRRLAQLPQGAREDSWADEALYERFDSMALASIFNDLHVENFVLTTRNDAA